MNDPAAVETAPDSLRAVPRERPACRRPLGSSLRMATAEAGSLGRAEIESFVGDLFVRKHDATVTSFMPTLLSFRDAAGALRGAVGLRNAGDHPLYLEQYLDQPVESAVASATRRPVHRRQVVEVGNLAGVNCRTAVRMVALLPAYLLAHDYQWIVFTATSAVREILLGFGAPLIELARADSTRVALGSDRWGRYYETDPRVFVGFLPDSRNIRGFSTIGHDH